MGVTYRLRVQAIGTGPGDASAVVRSLLRLLEGGVKQRDEEGQGAADGGDKARDEALCAALLSQWRRSLWRNGSSSAGGLHAAGRRVEACMQLVCSGCVCMCTRVCMCMCMCMCMHVHVHAHLHVHVHVHAHARVHVHVLTGVWKLPSYS